MLPYSKGIQKEESSLFIFGFLREESRQRLRAFIWGARDKVGRSQIVSSGGEVERWGGSWGGREGGFPERVDCNCLLPTRTRRLVAGGRLCLCAVERKSRAKWLTRFGGTARAYPLRPQLHCAREESRDFFAPLFLCSSRHCATIRAAVAISFTPTHFRARYCAKCSLVYTLSANFVHVDEEADASPISYFLQIALSD